MAGIVNYILKKENHLKIEFLNIFKHKEIFGKIGILSWFGNNMMYTCHKAL